MKVIVKTVPTTCSQCKFFVLNRKNKGVCEFGTKQINCPCTTRDTIEHKSLSQHVIFNPKDVLV